MSPALLTDQVKITKVKDPTTDGTSAVDSDPVDMQANGGWDGVIFLTSYATPAAGNKIHAECSSDGGSPDTFADIRESEIDGGASDEDQVVDVYQPPERYVRASCLRGTSSVLGDVWAIQYRGRKLPASSTVSGTLVVKQCVQQPEGTK